MGRLKGHAPFVAFRLPIPPGHAYRSQFTAPRSSVIGRTGAAQPALRYHRPMQQDYLGNPITAQRDATLRGIDDFIEGYLAYETRAERILGAADADPGSCLANVYAGLLWMLLEAPDAARHAAQYLAAAERAAPLAPRREQLNAAGLRAWGA